MKNETKITPEDSPKNGVARGMLDTLVIPLLPCPFCGEAVNDSDFYKRFDTWDDHGVERDFSDWVMECCLTFTFSSETKEEAQREWNKRINATETWNKATELPYFLQTNAIWGVLRELEKMGAITIDASSDV